MLKADQTSKS